MTWNQGHMSYCWPEIQCNKFSVRPDLFYEKYFSEGAMMKKKAEKAHRAAGGAFGKDAEKMKSFNSFKFKEDDAPGEGEFNDPARITATTAASSRVLDDSVHTFFDVDVNTLSGAVWGEHDEIVEPPIVVEPVTPE